MSRVHGRLPAHQILWDLTNGHPNLYVHGAYFDRRLMAVPSRAYCVQVLRAAGVLKPSS